MLLEYLVFLVVFINSFFFSFSLVVKGIFFFGFQVANYHIKKKKEQPLLRFLTFTVFL